LKSGSLNLLEPSGPVKDCNGIEKIILKRYFSHIREEVRRSRND
jgi:hypothetical protein